MTKHCKEVGSTDICRYLIEYCKAMECWCKRARRDIIDLERAVCELQRKGGPVSDPFICDKGPCGDDRRPSGDPGIPPDPPDWDD